MNIIANTPIKYSIVNLKENLLLGVLSSLIII